MLGLAKHLTSKGHEVSMICLKGVDIEPETIHPSLFTLSYIPNGSHQEIAEISKNLQDMNGEELMVLMGKTKILWLTPEYISYLNSENYDLLIIEFDFFSIVLSDALDIKVLKIFNSWIEPVETVLNRFPVYSSYMFFYPLSSSLREIAAFFPHPHSFISRAIKLKSQFDFYVIAEYMKSLVEIPLYLKETNSRGGKKFIVEIGAEGFLDPVMKAPNAKYVFPYYPNMEVEKLDEEYLEFLKKFKKVVVVSEGMGLMMYEGSESMILKTIESKPDIGFIMSEKDPKLLEDIQKKSFPNLLVKSYIPETLLMEEEEVKAFISHCGYNSLIESIYNRKPLIGNPEAVDQFHNCKMIEELNLGVCLMDSSFTTENFKKSIELFTSEALTQEDEERKKIILENVYLKSQLLIEQEKNGKDIEYWINYVVEYGHQELLPAYFEIYWWEYFNLDIIVLGIFIFFTGRIIVSKKIFKRNK